VTPEQIALVRPRLVAFAGQMLDGLPRADQRAKGELCLRGLLMDGRRKSMQPMAERLGVDHQGLQQFVTSSTWDYERVRGNVARWAMDAIGPDAYVVDDTGFPKDGAASPLVARMYSGTLGKTGNCQIGMSVQMVTDRASLAANWRLFCPASWHDTMLDDPAEAQRVRHRRQRAGIPDHIRHREKWRLALDMLDQMTGQWQLPKRPVVADAGYGDTTELRMGLDERGLDYVLQADADINAYPADAVPVTAAYCGRGRVPTPRYPASHPTCVPSLSPPAAPPADVSPGGRAHARPPATPPPPCAHTSWPSASTRQLAHPPHCGRASARRVAHRRMATRRTRTGQVLAIQHGRPDSAEDPGPASDDPLANRTRLPRTQNRPRPGPLRRPLLYRLAPPRHPHRPRPSLLHPATPGPKAAAPA
jgi:DDE superfamily endonuclease